MADAGDPALMARLMPGARQLVLDARDARPAREKGLESNDWLLAVLVRNGPLVEVMAPAVSSADRLAAVRAALARGEGGAPLPEAELVDRATQSAQARGRALASERDIIAVLLDVRLAAPPRAAEVADAEGTRQPAGTGTNGVVEPAPADVRPTAVPPWQPRAAGPTPTLERFGRDLTRQASENGLSTIVGRDGEIELVIETLCRSQKRNPVLVGPAGIGKTAIVEGLARRIVTGTIPQVLRGARIIQLSPSSLVAGAGVVGELENRLRGILAEAAQDGIIVFIDEVHSIVGAGGARGTGDIASLLKPALARGDIACIAATTDDEYRAFVEADTALERRFNPVRVHELTAAETLEVLAAHRDDLTALRGVRVSDEILAWLVDFAARVMPNRRFPDKAIDLVEQCVAHAVAQGRPEVGKADAEAVVRRMVGMPLTAEERLESLNRELAARRLMNEPIARKFVGRLRVTLRGLDTHPARPNAVVLLQGPAAARADELCATVSSALFGTPGRVVVIDLGQMSEAHDTTLLLGAPPGYVGYNESLPIHEIAQMPWSVVRLENVDAAHPRIRELIAEALGSGYLADGAGRRIYLSDTVLVLTATGAENHRAIGFGAPVTGGAGAADSTGAAGAGAADAAGPDRSIAALLGPVLAAHVDIVCSEDRPAGALKDWLEDVLLAGLQGRCRDQGIDLTWDRTLVEWLAHQSVGDGTLHEWERFVDECVDPELVVRLDQVPAGQRIALTLRAADGSLLVEQSDGAPGGA